MSGKMKLEDLGVWTLEFVTPEIASTWLETKAPNRPLMTGRINEYSRSMQSNSWKITHQGIAFDMEGKLIDGQHRLCSIIKSRIPQWMMVFRWRVSTDILALDDGKSRTIRDVAALSGLHTGTWEPAVVRVIAFAATNGQSKDKGRLTRNDSLRMIEERRDAMEWVLDRLGHDKGTCCAVVGAVITMAWYTCNRYRLEEFCKILRSGVCTSEQDNAAIRVRDFIMSPRSMSGGSNVRMAAFRKIQGGLRAFLEYKSMSRLCEVQGIVFPIKTNE